MRLFIMRHGEAAPDFMNDDARQLTERGQAEARMQGQRLAAMCERFDLVAVSPLVRTQQTADCVCEYISATERVTWEALVHSSYPSKVENMLADLSAKTVLLVSHMPLVASLEAYLRYSDEFKGQPFQTSEISILSSKDPYPGNWQFLERVKASV